MLSDQYDAGFFDGEGCVNLTIRGKNCQISLRVMITNTDPNILQEFKDTYGGRLTKPRVLTEGWKAFRQIVLSDSDAIEFLRRVFPFCIVKRKQIELAEEFWTFQHQGKRQRCEKVLKKVNGKTVVTFQRTAETLERESEFKFRMSELNRKGTV